MQIKTVKKYLAGNKKRLAVTILLLLVVVYTLIGFFAVPPIGKHYAREYLATELNHQLQIGKLRFNPFTLVIELDEMELSSDNSLIGSVRHMRVNADISGIFRKTLVLSEFSVHNPLLMIVIDEKGNVNLDRFLEKLPKDSNTEKANGNIDLVLGKSSINNGVVSIIDRSQQAEVTSTIDNINLDLSGLSTIEQEQGNYSIRFTPTRSSNLNIVGSVSLVPLSVSGEFSLSNLDIGNLEDWLTSYLPVANAQGRIQGNGRYLLSTTKDGKTGIIVNKTSLELSDASFMHTGTGHTFSLSDSAITDLKLSAEQVLHLPTIELGALQVSDPDENTLLAAGESSINNLLIDIPAVSLSLSAFGMNDIQALVRDDGSQLVSLKNISMDSLSYSGTDKRMQAGVVSLATPEITFNTGPDGKIVLPELTTQSPASGNTSKEQDNTDGQGMPVVSVEKLEILDSKISSLAHNEASARELLAIDELILEEGAIDPGNQSINVARVQAGNGRANLSVSTKGEIDIMQFFPETTPAGEQTAERQTGSDWQFRLDSVETNDIRIGVDSELHDIVQQHEINIRRLEVDNIASTGDRAAIELDAVINNAGELQSSGWVMLPGMAMEQEISLQNMPLLFADPFLQQASGLQLHGGTLSLDGKVHYEPADNTFQFTGSNTAVTDFQLNRKSNGQKLFAVDNIALETVTASGNPLHFHVDSIMLSSPYADIRIDEDQNLNILEVISATNNRRQKAPSPVKAGELPAIDVLIERIDVQEGQLDFADLSLVPQFSTKINKLSGTASGLSTDPGKYTSMKLEGQVNEYGSAKITGELQPFNYREKSIVTMQFRNIDTKSLTPYTAKFAGRKIESGSLSLHLDYEVDNSKLSGKNNVILQSLVLGEKVESPDAMDLPLDMAIGLLQDDEGRIDINVPITGDLDNPEFQLDAVIQKAVGSLIGGIVTAPFRFIGQLFGESGDDLKEIAFEPGSSNIAPPEAGDIETLSRALLKRPSLTIGVTGVYDAKRDKPPLARQQLVDVLSERIGKSVIPLNYSSPELQSTLELLGRQRLDTDTLQSLREKHNLTSRGVDGTEPGAIDFYRELFTVMRDQIDIPEDDLRDLASKRATNIADKLAELEPSITDRVIKSSDIVAVDSQGELVSVTLTAGTTK